MTEKTANKLTIQVTIPEDYVLIEKVEYDRLLDESDYGKWWGLKDVLARVNRKDTWFKQNILSNTRWRRKIDVNNGGFVYYPKGGKDSYLFEPQRTKEFLKTHFEDILKE